MKRGEFLKNLGLLTAGVVLAPTVFSEMVKDTPKYVQSGSIYSDIIVLKNGNIRYIGQNANTYTPLELHRWLSGQASIRHTDHLIELLNPYHITEETAKRLRGGSIIQKSGTEIYS